MYLCNKDFKNCEEKKKKKKIESIRIYRQCPWRALDADLWLRFFPCDNGFFVCLLCMEKLPRLETEPEVSKV